MFGNLIEDVKKGAMTLLPKIQNHSRTQSRYQVAGMILAHKIANDPELMVSTKNLKEAAKACIFAAALLQDEVDRQNPEVCDPE